MPAHRVMNPTFFVTRTGHRIVVAEAVGDTGGLLLYDTMMRRLTEIEGPARRLGWFVDRPSRNELWFLDNGLYRLDFMSARAEAIPLGWTPTQLNILPRRDTLVLDRPRENGLSFIRLDTRQVTRNVTLPLPAQR